MNVHETVADDLRSAGQRYTAARRSLVSALMQIGGPARAQDILDHATDLSASSMYRNLSALEDARIVRRLPTTDDAARFELAERFTEHHHHLVCEHCGKVQDITLPAAAEKTLHALADSVGPLAGWKITGHRLELIGCCSPRSCTQQQPA